MKNKYKNIPDSILFYMIGFLSPIMFTAYLYADSLMCLISLVAFANSCYLYVIDSFSELKNETLNDIKKTIESIIAKKELSNEIKH